MPMWLAFGQAPHPAVSTHILLTGIQTGPLSLVADAVELIVLALYGVGVRRLARRGRPWPLWHTAVFVVGMVAMWVAVGSGLAAYDDVNVSMHVIQHVLLMMVAPPLIALGKPVTLATQAANRANQVRILKVVHSRVVGVLTFPVVAWFLYYGTMYVFFMTGVYPYSVAHPLFHDGTHLWFFAVGYLYWHPLVGLDPARWRWPPLVRAVSLFMGMPFEVFLGIALTQLPTPLAPINTLANTHQAGDTFWILAMVTTGGWLAVVLFQWFRQLERETVREDRRLETANAENRAWAHDLGIDLAPGLTVPWWRLAELERQQQQHASHDGGTGTAPEEPGTG